MTLDQTGHEPLQALESFITGAMGAKDLSARLDTALKLQTYLQGGKAEFVISPSDDDAFEQLIADYDRDPALFAAYFTTLSRAQTLIDKFKTLSPGELKYLDHMFNHAYASRIDNTSELFDHRSWLKLDKNSNRYILPMTGSAHARPHFKGAFRPAESRLMMLFLNIEVPRFDSLAASGRITQHKFSVPAFDAHVQERRADMKQEQRLQARELFLSWFGAVPPKYVRIMFGHLFPQSEEFKLHRDHKKPALADTARLFIEDSAIRDAMASADYKVAEPEIVAEAAPEIAAQAAEPEITVMTAVDAINNVRSLVEEYTASKTAPVSVPVIPMDAYELPEATPVAASAEDNVVTLFTEPTRRIARGPLGRANLGTRLSVDDMFPPYERPPIIPGPRKEQPIDAPKMVAAVLPMPSRRPKSVFTRVAAVAAIVLTTLGVVGISHYEPVRSAGAAQTLKSLYNDVTGETTRLEQARVREVIEAQKPVVKAKIPDRLGDPKPACKPSAASADPYKPKSVCTTVIPGDGIDNLMPTATAQQKQLRPVMR